MIGAILAAVAHDLSAFVNVVSLVKYPPIARRDQFVEVTKCTVLVDEGHVLSVGFTRLLDRLTGFVDPVGGAPVAP